MYLELFRKITKTFQFLEVSAVSALIFWSLKYAPAALKISGEYLVNVAAYLCNHHVVFLIGNAIILSLFLLCSQKDERGNHSGTGDFAVNNVEHCEVSSISVFTTEIESIPPETVMKEEGIGGEKEIEAIATTQIKKFRKMRPNKVKSEVAVTSREEIRRPETENYWRSGEKKTSIIAAEIEMLSNEEFQLTIQAFIHKHRQSFLDQRLADYHTR